MQLSDDRPVLRGLLALLTLLACAPARAADEALPGAVLVIKPGTLVKVVARASAVPFTLPDASDDPTLEGGMLQVYDTGGAGGADTYALSIQAPPLGWKALGSPPGAKGYRYKGAGSVADPCTTVVVKPAVVKAVCRGAGVTLTLPAAGDIGVLLSIGTETKRYGALFGGTVVSSGSTLLKRREAPPTLPPPPPTTTSTSSTTSTTLPCCNGDAFLNFTTTYAPADCGDIVRSDGTLAANLACSGYYGGGGANLAPLPYATPDSTSLVWSVASCTGQVATLGPTTSAQTGSSRNCTSPGCLVGAPLPVPVTPLPGVSVCVITRIDTSPSGVLECSTGATDVVLPLEQTFYITGDTQTDPFSSIPGVQPCPLCSAGTCIGGPEHGSPCLPDTTTLGGNTAYPTSHDCPPSPAYNAGSAIIGMTLSSGTVSWTATPATNDTGHTASQQTRVFTGYCRDRNGTDTFENPPKRCWEDGIAVGSPCAEPFESCEQRSQGAFGPNGTTIKTITAIGSATGVLGGPGAATLVSLFSIPPYVDPTVDAYYSYPGPGAVALSGTAQTCAAANPCP